MKSVALTDKNYQQPGLVQLLLGADVYEDRVLDIRKEDHGLHYRKSLFDRVAIGVLSHVRGFHCQSLSSCSGTGSCSLFEVEEIPRGTNQ